MAWALDRFGVYFSVAWIMVLSIVPLYLVLGIIIRVGHLVLTEFLLLWGRDDSYPEL